MLGVDLGTTYSAAAVLDDAGTRVVSLAHDRYAIPSVVAPAQGGSGALVGGPALTIAATEPDRVAREFKRRFGDSTPLIVGGEPWMPEALTGLLLRAIVDKVRDEMGEPPDDVVLTYPATWREHRLDLLRSMVEEVDLGHVRFVTEPVAAAINYHDRQTLRNEPVRDGALVAVYDLGGGTFDAAVLELRGENFSIRGEPEGLGFLGGIDFDLMVLSLVKEKAAEELAAVDPEDPATVLALARLREQCTLAKEVLSQEHSAIVPVALPRSTGRVVVQREEFEAGIDDLVEQTVDALERSLNSAGLSDGSDVDSVLLVGGSSRVPLVSTRLGERLGVPVLVDTHPKQAVALGAARASVPLASAARAVTAPITVDAAKALDTVSAEPTVLPPMTVGIAGSQLEERYLLVLNGPMSGTTINVRTSPTTIGRLTTDTTIGLNDPRVSRRHLTVAKTADGVLINDLGSTNGTWADGHPVIEDVRIEPGGIVEVGSTLLLLEAPFFALPAPEMLASSWSLPRLMLRQGLGGRFANRRAGREWLDEFGGQFGEVEPLVDRVRRSRRMFRPSGPRTLAWCSYAPERIFPRSTNDDYYGSVTLGHGPAPTLFDFAAPSGLKAVEREEFNKHFSDFAVDPWVPISLPILGTTTTLALGATEAKALLRSVLYEFVHFHPNEALTVFGIDPQAEEWNFLEAGTVSAGKGPGVNDGLVVSYTPSRTDTVRDGGADVSGTAGSVRVGELPAQLGPGDAVVVPTPEEGVFQLVRTDTPALNLIPSTLPAGRVPTTNQT